MRKPILPLFAGIHRGRLAIGMCVATVLSLSVHAVMLQLFHAPYPGASLGSKLPAVVNDAVMIYAASWLYRSLCLSLPLRSPLCRITVLFVILACLNETLRGWFMNGYCSTPWTTSWLYETFTSLRGIAYYAAASVMSAAIYRCRQRSGRIVAAVLLALLLNFVLMSRLASVLSIVLAYVESLAPTGGRCQMPYGPEVLIPAYLSFVEPAIASLFCVAFTWRYSSARRCAFAWQFAVLVLALKKQLLMAYVYAIYAPMPAWTALASMGQFTLEAAALGLLTAVAWQFAKDGPPCG
ncbi:MULTISPECIES: hypothetical protein [Burkholderia]|uniref:hypothetical protein n=1 Tax=Burkholderia TaxID=32008 RepID=UPI001589B9C9|nr:hypothetical protein [Burkholderia ambifaria]